MSSNAKLFNPRFNWDKRGRIFGADGRFDWMQSHAQCPVVLPMADRLRIYYTTRPGPDERGEFVSYTSFIEVERREPKNILYVHDLPILELGELGAFDQFGVMPGCVVRHGQEVRLYYVGWSRSRGIPYDAAIGLAISDDGGVTFRRLGRGPLFGKTPAEPFMQGSSAVIQHEGLWHIWYVSGTQWVQGDRVAEPIYLLMHATSPDGLNWTRDGRPCIPMQSAQECQASPALVHRNGEWHMWFSFRRGLDFRNASGGYRIGYARSHDLLHWTRDDDANYLPPSAEGWDSEMVCYPCVSDVDGSLMLFYSGNYFGRDGFGYAALRS